MLGTYHRRGTQYTPAIKLYDIPEDSPDGGVTFLARDNYIHEFDYPAIFNYSFQDQRGIAHRENSKGTLIQNDSQYIFRFALDFQVLTVGTVTGGVLESIGDTEMLLYLEKHKKLFSAAGRLSSKMELILNYDSSMDWDAVGQEKSFEVAPIGTISLEHVANESCTGTIIFETTNYIEIPYFLTRNRS
jgi:hypothetical protein